MAKTDILHTENRIWMDSRADVIYELAADILDWPRILSHYRYVRVLGENSAGAVQGERCVKMAAWRTGIPVSWTSIQRMDPNARRVTYTHVGGFTKGMDVEWVIEQSNGGCEVRILHDLDSPRWWLRTRLARFIMGRIFVEHIADKTLRGIKIAAEANRQR